jgi:hypothetical protein
MLQCLAATMLTTLLLGLQSQPAQANPFTPAPGAAPAGKPGTAAVPAAQTTPVAAPAPSRPVPSTMPPGTPSQAAGSPLPSSGTVLEDKQPSQAEWLDRLAISSVIGQRVLLRLARGHEVQATQAAPISSLSGAAGNAGGGGQANVGSQAFTLLRAQHMRPFVLGREAYVPVVDGFSVTLFKASDKDMRSPLWVGEPAPARSHQLGPNMQEFANPPTTTAGQMPPSVMPSSAFGANGPGAGTGAGTQTGTNTGTGTQAK